MTVEISDQMQIPTEDQEGADDMGPESGEEIIDEGGIFPGMDTEELPMDTDEDAEAPNVEVMP